jgi:hypothetical protein
MTTIPASQLVQVNPSVISVGGSAINITGLMLTPSTRPPLSANGVPTVPQFASLVSVQSYFGSASPEAAKAAVYFQGYSIGTKKPALLKVAQYALDAVPAYLRGANVSSLTLAQLQAISGSLNITIDGYPRNVAALNLSAATSFSNAATLIQTALNTGASDPTEAVVTGSIAASTASFTGAVQGFYLTVTAMTSGTIEIGGLLTGAGVAASTFINGQISGTTGGIGLYTVSVSQTVASEALTETFGTLTVTGVTSGIVAVGLTVTGAGVAAGTIVGSLGSGTGGNGTYFVNLTQTVASESLTLTATPVAVIFDSISGAFIVTSGITGAFSTIAFATGTTSSALGLASGGGGVTSQGAAAPAPAAYMNSLVIVDPNWVTFTTIFDPDQGAGNTQKQAFAAWKNTQNSVYAYICGDFDATAPVSVPASTSLGQILPANGDSGTCLCWQPSDLNLTAFVMGAAASIDFTKAGGRITFAFKNQAGLVPGVSDPTSALNLAGNPQALSSFGNGYNFYGAYGLANSLFQWFQRGTVTGPYLWLDSYINQIWFNANAQLALLTVFGSSNSIPFNQAGAGVIAAGLNDIIAQGLNFGMFAPGTISASEIQQVNTAAGANVANTLQTQGWYLQVLQQSSAVRANRGPWAITFWYLDRGSVQSIVLSSVATQ